MNREYPIKLDLQFATNNRKVKFLELDNETSDFYLNISTGGSAIEIDNAIAVLAVIKPSGDVEAQFIEVKGKGIVYANLKPSLKDTVGDYQARAMLILNDKRVTTDIIGYTVEGDGIFTELNKSVQNDSRFRLLTDMFNRLSNIEIQEVSRLTNENNRISAENSRVESNRQMSVDHSAMVEAINKLVSDVNKAIASGTVDLELKEARGESETLKLELERIETKGKEIYADVEGEYITVNDSVKGNITDIEILGNTVQGNDLADIKSAGILKEDGTFEMSISSTSDNIYNGELERGNIFTSSGLEGVSENNVRSKYIPIRKDCLVSRYDVNVGVYVYHYDLNFKYLGYTSWNTGRTKSTDLTLYPSTKFIRFVFANSGDILLKSKVEYTTVATNYTEHQSTKSTISLPCELGKVGDVADRLYYDDAEKAWCIEKIGNMLLSKSNISTPPGVVKVNVPNCNYGWGVTSFMIEGFKTKNTDVALGENEFYSAGDGFYTKNKSIEDLVGKKILYKTTTPTKIILPLSTQIALNSYFGTTHISVDSGEVQAKFKGRVPKSTQASLQSLASKTDILDHRLTSIEGLKESQNMRYETETGYIVAEKTVDGVVKDWLIKGKTSIVDVDGNVVEAGTPGAILKSVGDGVQEIEISSVKSDGNLTDSKIQKIWTDSANTIIQAQNSVSVVLDVIPNTDYVFSTKENFDRAIVKGSSVPITLGTVVNDNVTRYKATSNTVEFNSGNNKHIIILLNTTTLEYTEINLNKGRVVKPYEPHKSHEKSILYYKPLAQQVLDKEGRALASEYELVALGRNQPLREFDYVEEKNDKTILHICSIERPYVAGDETKANCITDMTTTVEKSATETVYDCPNLNLSSYYNETMISINSGAINPHMEFAITSHINELVKSNTNRINQVEAEIYKEQQIQNAMIFDNDLRLMDMEFLLEDIMPMAKDKINILRGEYMKNLESRGQTEFEFLKERIECGSYTDEYLERAINKYKKANRLTQEEYNILYDMIYPPVYEEVLPVR